jgi:RNA polymerase sigma factor for flagellar operon FliA
MGLALGFMLEGTGLFAEAATESAGAAPKDTAYDSLAWKDTVSHLHREIATLPEKEQIVLKQHYLNGLSFDQLAALLAVSKGRVSQLHRAALQTLRKRIRASDRFRILP